jgi:hypothetical protein
MTAPLRPAESIRDVVTRLFEQARQSPGATYQPDRFLAHLTAPAATTGRRVRDTFAGRRRFVRFMHAVQLELAICFTQSEWDGVFGENEFIALLETKVAKPQVALRLARKRMQEAGMQLIEAPVKFGLLAIPLLIGALLARSAGPRLLLGSTWAAITGGVAFLAWRESIYAHKLVERIAQTPSNER